MHGPNGDGRKWEKYIALLTLLSIFDKYCMDTIVQSQSVAQQYI